MAELEQCKIWLEKNGLELVDVVSVSRQQGVHVKVRRKDGTSPPPLLKSLMVSSQSPKSTARSEKKSTRRKTPKKKAASSILAVDELSPQQEEGVFGSEGEVLEPSTGTLSSILNDASASVRVAADSATRRPQVEEGETLEPRTVTSSSPADEYLESDTFSDKLQPASKYEALAKEIREKHAKEDAEIAAQWGTCKMMVGMELIKKKCKAPQLVLDWDKKGKGVVSKVEFRQGIKESLTVKTDMKSLDALFDSFDQDGGGTLDANELKDALSQIKHDCEQLKLREASKLERQPADKHHISRLEQIAAATRKANMALRALESEASVQDNVLERERRKWAAAELEQAAADLQGALAAEEAAKRKLEDEARAAVEAAKREQERLEDEARRAAEAEAARKAEAERKRAIEDAVTLDSSDSLAERIRALKNEIKALEPVSNPPTAEQQLSASLAQKKLQPKDLVKEWDKKHTGEVNKLDFRRGVRALGVKSEDKDIDNLFASLDEDGGGTLTAEELKNALKGMQNAAVEGIEEAEYRAARQLRIKSFVSKLESLVPLTKMAEEAIAKHAKLKKTKSNEAEVEAAYAVAAAQKRNAVVVQIEVAQNLEVLNHLNEAAALQLLNAKTMRADADGKEKAKIAERKRKQEEEEKRKKAAQIARLESKRQPAEAKMVPP
jgi:Ca2+-binding EF-hand superfamily protein